MNTLPVSPSKSTGHSSKALELDVYMQALSVVRSYRSFRSNLPAFDRRRDHYKPVTGNRLADAGKWISHRLCGGHTGSIAITMMRRLGKVSSDGSRVRDAEAWVPHPESETWLLTPRRSLMLLEESPLVTRHPGVLKGKVTVARRIFVTCAYCSLYWVVVEGIGRVLVSCSHCAITGNVPE
jgi:hypothetical protein